MIPLFLELMSRVHKKRRPFQILITRNLLCSFDSSECFEIMIQKTQGFRYTRGIYMRIFLNHSFFEALRPVKLIQYVADCSILASIMDNLQTILKFDLGKIVNKIFHNSLIGHLKVNKTAKLCCETLKIRKI